MLTASQVPMQLSEDCSFNLCHSFTPQSTLIECHALGCRSARGGTPQLYFHKQSSLFLQSAPRKDGLCRGGEIAL